MSGGKCVWHAVWLLVGALIMLSTPVRAASQTLTVFAAASLTDAFAALATRFEATHPGTKVVLHLAGSQELARQLHHGAPADVYAAADEAHMQDAIRSGRIAPADSHVFALNHLVVIVAKPPRQAVSTLADLARPGLTLIIGDEAVPVGRYTRQFLDRASSAYGADFKRRVLANVISMEPSVRAILTKVALNEADAGIVYVSDVQGSARTKLTTLAIPDRFNTVARYPVAVVRDSPRRPLAEAFSAYLRSPEGQRLLQNHGFIPVTPPARRAS